MLSEGILESTMTKKVINLTQRMCYFTFCKHYVHSSQQLPAFERWQKKTTSVNLAEQYFWRQHLLSFSCLRLKTSEEKKKHVVRRMKRWPGGMCLFWRPLLMPYLQLILQSLPLYIFPFVFSVLCQFIDCLPLLCLFVSSLIGFSLGFCQSV